MSKIINKITEQDREKWVVIRTRLKKALEDEKTILKRDLHICNAIHKRVFNKPQTQPSINCCIDIATWLEMVKNINKAYTAKKGKE